MIICTPAPSAARASETALRCAALQPVRIFSVTGTPCGAQAATTASMMRSASASFCISALPDHWLHTLRAGQPMLMSITCAPRATFQAALSAMAAASAPTICTAKGPGSPSWRPRRRLLAVPRKSGRAATISATA